MGRAGVTLQEVEKAILQLQERGKNPSVDAVRKFIGTGSKSTMFKSYNSGLFDSDIKNLIPYFNQNFSIKYINFDDNNFGDDVAEDLNNLQYVEGLILSRTNMDDTGAIKLIDKNRFNKVSVVGIASF